MISLYVGGRIISCKSRAYPILGKVVELAIVPRCDLLLWILENEFIVVVEFTIWLMKIFYLEVYLFILLRVKDSEVRLDIPIFFIPVFLVDESWRIYNPYKRLRNKIESTLDRPSDKTSNTLSHTVAATSETFGLRSMIWLVYNTTYASKNSFD